MSTPCFMALTWAFWLTPPRITAMLEIEEAAIGAQALLDLHRQFAGGRQDQRLGLARPGRHMADGKLLQQRQAEGGGLAGAGLGDAQKIAARPAAPGWPGPGWGWGWCNSLPQGRAGSARQRQARQKSRQSRKVLKTGRRAPIQARGNGCCRLPRTLEGTEVQKNPAMTAIRPLCGRNGWRAISGYSTAESQAIYCVAARSNFRSATSGG